MYFLRICTKNATYFHQIYAVLVPKHRVFSVPCVPKSYKYSDLYIVIFGKSALNFQKSGIFEFCVPKSQEYALLVLKSHLVGISIL